MAFLSDLEWICFSNGSNNHKYIPITEFDRGYSIKVTRGAKKITTVRVAKGDGNENKE